MIRDRSERAQLTSKPLDLVVSGRQDRDQVPVMPLEVGEVGEFGVGAGESAGEPLVERFGLVHVDFDTQVRTPKASYGWYRDLIASQRGCSAQ
ncbi:family 1 glycosylhydrolase [Kitasatospora sp. NPDC097643]|uniref:family 1 glycosylhydrolase n=1 Tax=Kitasatospora sp. NPDC097643 TaxID=3157230 RepID=UPI003332B990